MPAGKCPDTGKTVYLTRREARLALDKVRLRRATNRTEQSAYNCPACGKWHITKIGEKKLTKFRETRLPPAKRWRWKRDREETNE